MSGGGIDPGPGRVSIYQRDPSSPKGYRLESARLFDDIAELTAGGVDLDVDVLSASTSTPRQGRRGRRRPPLRRCPAPGLLDVLSEARRTPAWPGLAVLVFQAARPDKELGERGARSVGADAGEVGVGVQTEREAELHDEIDEQPTDGGGGC